MNCDSIRACTLFDKLEGVSAADDVEPLNRVVVGLLEYAFLKEVFDPYELLGV